MGAGRLVVVSVLVHEGEPGHTLRVPVALAGRDSSAVAPVVASVVLTFTRDTGTQITQTNLTSIPTHQHDRDDRIRGRLNQKNPLLFKGSTEISRFSAVLITSCARKWRRPLSAYGAQT